LHLLLGEPVPPPAIWWTPVLGMLLWPLVFVLLDAVRLGRRGD
jgi:rod shape-determining protein MreD